VSADLSVIVDDPGILERSADPGEFLMLACERAKSWLAEALEHGEIERIAEMKAQAEAIRVYTVSKQLGKDAQASATEIVRRAERGLGQAARKGQRDGTITTAADGGWSARNLPRNDVNRKIPVAEYLGSGGARSDIYSMTDGVTDTDFDEVLDEGRDEGNLTRANIARKLRQRRIPDRSDRSPSAASKRRDLIRRWGGQGWSSRQIAKRLGIDDQTVRNIARDHRITITADAVVRNMQRIDSNRVVSETVGAMEGLATGIGLVDIEDIDPASASEWAASLTESTRTLNRLIRQLRELTQ
jgi:hypothetical protein